MSHDRKTVSEYLSRFKCNEYYAPILQDLEKPLRIIDQDAGLIALVVRIIWHHCDTEDKTSDVGRVDERLLSLLEITRCCLSLIFLNGLIGTVSDTAKTITSFRDSVFPRFWGAVYKFFSALPEQSLQALPEIVVETVNDWLSLNPEQHQVYFASILCWQEWHNYCLENYQLPRITFTNFANPVKVNANIMRNQDEKLFPWASLPDTFRHVEDFMNDKEELISSQMTLWRCFMERLVDDELKELKQKNVFSTPFSQISLAFHFDEALVSRTITGSLQQPASSPSYTISKDSHIHENGANTIYSVGSMSNLFYITAFCCAFYSKRFDTFSWSSSARDVLNHFRQKNGESQMAEFGIGPTILEILTHVNALPNMDMFFTAPDGTWLVSQDDFVENGPAFIKAKTKNQSGDMYEYSNANIVMAGMILKAAMGKELDELMNELVLQPLRLHHTVFSLRRLNELRQSGANIVHGHVQGKERQSNVHFEDDLSSIIFGALSCTDDISMLLYEFIKASDGRSSLIRQGDGQRFLSPQYTCQGLFRPSLGGLICPVDSTVPGHHTLARRMTPKPQTDMRAGTADLSVCYLAGHADGFTNAIYVSQDGKAFVVALSNNLGGLDFADIIARGLLYDVLRQLGVAQKKLWPVNYVSQLFHDHNL